MVVLNTPHLDIPESPATVNVKVIQACRDIEIPGFVWKSNVFGVVTNGVSTGSFAFLIENERIGKKVMFDLGPRKDKEKCSPAVQKLLKQFIVDVEKDVATQLTEGGVDLSTIDEIIPSHFHMDHLGDPATFPSTTTLVLGPGTLEAASPGYPADPDSQHLAESFTGRHVEEIDFTDDIMIGGFRAHDRFGDGSFYLLDVPGHCPGHMCALAQTGPGEWIFCGADAVHHPGMLRPSRWNPIPSTVSVPENLATASGHRPFLSNPREGPTMHQNRPLAIQSLEKIVAFDAAPNVFVILAHDASMDETLELFPASANDWRKKGWKERTMWSFLQEKNRMYCWV